jgi:hypothetical protein
MLFVGSGFILREARGVMVNRALRETPANERDFKRL